MSSLDLSPCTGLNYVRWPADKPCPSIEEFQYTIDPGIKRTELDNGKTIQRRTYKHKPRVYDLVWYVNQEELNWLIIALDDAGVRNGWIALPLITDQNPKWNVPAEYPVRFIDDPQIELVKENLWKVSVSAEQLVDVTECITALQCGELYSCLLSMSIPIPTLNYQLLHQYWVP